MAVFVPMKACQLFLEHKQLRIDQMKSQTEKLNDDSYIPYNRPSDAADRHLDVNSFQKEAANATLDLASKGQTGKKEKPRQVRIIPLTHARPR